MAIQEVHHMTQQQLLAEIEAYIDAVYTGADMDLYAAMGSCDGMPRVYRSVGRAAEDDDECMLAASCELAAPLEPEVDACKNLTLDEALDQLEEGFSETLLHLIDASGMTDAQCYKKANIDRKLFHKIRTNKLYKPSKPTVLAFALALQLSLEDTKELLAKAGYALSHASKFDIIVEFCIQHGLYNVYEVNEILLKFDQGLIGM